MAIKVYTIVSPFHIDYINIVANGQLFGFVFLMEVVCTNHSNKYIDVDF